MSVVNIYHFKGYPKPLKSKLYRQTVFLYYENKEDAEEASRIAKSKWSKVDPALQHPSYCSLGIGEIEYMANGVFCVHIP
jgi:hypothetical protein